MAGSGPHQENGHLQLVHDGLGHTSVDEVGQTRPPVGTHHHQVSVGPLDFSMGREGSIMGLLYVLG